MKDCNPVKSKPEQRSERRRNKPKVNCFRYAEGVTSRMNLLLPDKRAAGRANQVTTLALELLGEDLKGLDSGEVGYRIEEIATEYWNERRWNERIRLSQLKSTAKRIISAAAKLQKLLDESPEYPSLVGTYLNHPWASVRERTSGLGNLDSTLDVLIEVYENATAATGHLGAPEKTHIKMATGALVKLWTDASGKEIVRNYQTARGKGGRREDFSYPSFRFVHLVLEAIDPKITLGEVRTALKSVLSARQSQSKKGSKKSGIPD